MGGALCVKVNILPLSLRVALRAFLSNFLFLRLYINYYARRRTLSKKKRYTSPFIVTFHIYTLLLYLGHSDPQKRY
jgi:hypothetical protein